MDEHEISAQRMFNELDVDGNGSDFFEELRTTLEKNYRMNLDLDDVNALMDAVDDDGDGMIDITEFYDSMESLDDHDEAVEARTRKGVPHALAKADDVQVMERRRGQYSTLVLAS